MTFSHHSVLSLSRFLLGYLFLFLVEVITIFVNELCDLPTDRINRNASPFNGGSRVLVKKELSIKAVKTALVLVFSLLALSSLFLVLLYPASSRSPVIILMAIGIFLGLGYTAPPMKFCYRGMGELVVALTHSLYVIACGFVFQVGSWAPLIASVLSLPLFFSVLSAITLAGIPDHRADKTVSKKTFSVLFGKRTACILTLVFATLALAAGTILWHFDVPGSSGSFLLIITTLHWMILVSATLCLFNSGNYDRRINGIMSIALSYIIWFGIIPLSAFLRS